MPDVSSLQACAENGGVFAMAIPPVAITLFVLEILWLAQLLVRTLKSRTDLSRVRDLVIEGSLAQAILVSDRRANDDVLAVCRASIVAIQSSGRVDQAVEKAMQEAGFRFGSNRRAWVRIAIAVVLVAVPGLLAAGGIVYAEGVVREAADALPDEPDRDALRAEAHQDPAFSCPVELGGLGVLALALPALAIGALELRRRSMATHDHAINTAASFAEMASRVVDPTHRVYQQEKDRRR